MGQNGYKNILDEMNQELAWVYDKIPFFDFNQLSI